MMKGADGSPWSAARSASSGSVGRVSPSGARTGSTACPSSATGSYDRARNRTCGCSLDVLTVAHDALQKKRDRGQEIFAGVGAGYAFVGEVDTGGVLYAGGQELGIVAVELRGLPATYDVFLESHDARADAGSPILAASVGMTVRLGRFLMRPRLDMAVGAARIVEDTWTTSWRMETSAEVVTRREASSLNTEVRPRFLLLSVDLGWSSRRR